MWLAVWCNYTLSALLISRGCCIDSLARFGDTHVCSTWGAERLLTAHCTLNVTIECIMVHEKTAAGTNEAALFATHSTSVGGKTSQYLSDIFGEFWRQRSGIYCGGLTGVQGLYLRQLSKPKFREGQDLMPTIKLPSLFCPALKMFLINLQVWPSTWMSRQNQRFCLNRPVCSHYPWVFSAARVKRHCLKKRNGNHWSWQGRVLCCRNLHTVQTTGF